jgi:hypothetical protein
MPPADDKARPSKRQCFDDNFGIGNITQTQSYQGVTFSDSTQSSSVCRSGVWSASESIEYETEVVRPKRLDHFPNNGESTGLPEEADPVECCYGMVRFNAS